MKLLCSILLFFIINPVSLAANNQIRLTNGEWPPYLSEELPYYGFASHLVAEAFAAVGVEVEYEFFPWKRAFQHAKQGKGVADKVWNGTLLWIYTEERARDFLYSDMIIVDYEVLFFLKDSPLNWETMEDLQGKVIGGTAHTAYPTLEAAEKRGICSINRAGGYEALFKRLFAQRIDAIPNVKHVGEFLIRTSLTTEQQAQIISSPSVIEERKYYLILTKKIEENKKLMKLFNKGLRIIKENGVYDKLLQDLNDGKYDKALKTEPVLY